MRRFIGFCLGLALVLGLSPRGAAEGVAAKSAVLMDVQTGTVLFEQNPNEPLPPASVTKIMTMLLIMEAVDGGKITLEDKVTASERAAGKGGSQVYLKAGEIMSVSDMLKAIAVSSANDCACAMAEHLSGSEESFVAAMNERAQELGMKNTHFVNCTGLDDGPEAANHRTTAYDIALMSRELLGKHPKIRDYTTIWMDTLRNGAFGLSNTNKLIRFYPGATGLKTGFTTGAGYCLSATAKREDLELIAVVMGCETSKTRAAACKSLLDYGFANYCVAAPELPDGLSVRVKLGKEGSVPAVPAENALKLIKKEDRRNLETSVELPETLPAPITAGQPLGVARLRAGDRVIAEIPLVSEKTVEAQNTADIFKNLTRKFLFG